MSDDLDVHVYRLNDGTPIVIRPIRPEDRDELVRGFARLGPQSRLQRFMVPKAELTEAMLTYLTEVDGKDHVALVAFTDSPDFKRDVGLGVARFIRLPGEDGVAEAAVTVIDDAQGRGLGKLLLAVLTDEAKKRGIKTFRTEVLASNRAMLRLLEEASAVVREDDGDTVEFCSPAPAAAPAGGLDRRRRTSSPAPGRSKGRAPNAWRCADNRHWKGLGRRGARRVRRRSEYRRRALHRLRHPSAGRASRRLGRG
ncbi:MAG: GNAT family N-acetyltransferase [Polyangiaceae bacterium]|nr:GNAT family N-acetyltransferase [Polyangiaceae bacterium]